MKNTVSFLSLFIFIVVVACSKDDSSTVETELVLTKTERVVAAPIRNLSEHWWTVRDGLSDTFYIHNFANTVNANEKGFMAYDVNNNVFTDKLQSNEVESAGYMSQLFYHNGTINYIANNSSTYTIATNTWVQNAIPFPFNIENNHGESKSCVIDDKVFFVGGRDICKTVKFYSWSSNTWNFGADYPIAIENGPELAATNNSIYSLGGYNNGIYSKEFFRYDVSANAWAKLEDAPFSPVQRSSFSSMVSFKNKFIVYLGVDDKLHIYNIEKNKWQTTTVETDLFTDAHMEVSNDESKIFLLYRKENGSVGLQEYKQ